MSATSFGPNELAVFPLDEVGSEIVDDIRGLHHPGYTTVIEDLVEEHLPDRLDCAAALLQNLDLVNQITMAGLWNAKNIGTFKRMVKQDDVPAHLAELKMPRGYPSPLWLRGQAPGGTVPRWAPLVLDRLEFLSIRSVAVRLDLPEEDTTRRLKRTGDLTLRPITFIEGRKGRAGRIGAWLPGQLATYEQYRV